MTSPVVKNLTCLNDEDATTLNEMDYPVSIPPIGSLVS